MRFRRLSQSDSSTQTARFSLQVDRSEARGAELVYLYYEGMTYMKTDNPYSNMEYHYLLYPRHFGFPALSLESSALLITSLKLMRYTMEVFLGLGRYFGSVHQNILLTKLSLFGVSQPVWNGSGLSIWQKLFTKTYHRTQTEKHPHTSAGLVFACLVEPLCSPFLVVRLVAKMADRRGSWKAPDANRSRSRSRSRSPANRRPQEKDSSIGERLQRISGLPETQIKPSNPPENGASEAPKIDREKVRAPITRSSLVRDGFICNGFEN